MASLAYERGAAKARQCHRLYDRQRIIIAANNPYASADFRAEWQAGFNSEYSRKASA